MKNFRTQTIIIAVLALLLVVVSGALVSRMLADKTAAPAPVAVVPEENLNAAVNENSNPDSVPETVTGHDIENPRAIIPAEKIEQYGAKKISEKLGLRISALVETKPRLKTGDYGQSLELTFTKIGTIGGKDLYNIYQSCIIYIPPGYNELGGSADASPVPDNCRDIRAAAYFDTATKKFYAYKEYSYYLNESASKTLPPPLDKVSAVIDDKIPDLDPPKTVELAKGYVFTLTNPNAVMQPNHIWEEQREELKLVGQSLDGTNVYITKDGRSPYYSMMLPFYGSVSYTLNIPFFKDERIPKITWNDGSANSVDYASGRRGGCGGISGTNLMSAEQSEYFADRYAEAGKTNNGDIVYLPKGTDNPLVADAYRYSRYSDSTSEGVTIEQFMALKPIFVTNDPFGNHIIWTRSDSVPMAECGKPVVYLYPTQTEKVAVKLGSKITVTKSEPEYGKGWIVTAEPNGKLTTADGKTFPYLYWDGNGASYNAPTTGFVVASKDVEATLTEKLTALGLNDKEIADFNEFWVPIVSKSSYALISFVPQEEWSEAAPLNISPAPETIIRVFMDWKPLAAPVSIEPQILPPTPVRTGFTAVEWGGLLYR